MSVIQNRLVSTGLLGPCERPVHARYGENHIMNLNNTNVRMDMMCSER
jgi:hypothetical protein